MALVVVIVVVIIIVMEKTRFDCHQHLFLAIL